MFFRRKPGPEASGPLADEIARRVLGPTARGAAGQRFPTAHRYPFLSGWGEGCECGYLVEGAWGGRKLSLAVPLQLYRSEADRARARYSLTGLCLQLEAPGWRDREAYLFSGRPFRAPEGAGWVKNLPVRRREAWSAEAPLSPGEMERAAALVDWLEEEAAAAISARYGLFLGRGTAGMVFWEPELYDLEAQLRIITELLDRLPPSAL